jgi:hypothetical protein
MSLLKIMQFHPVNFVIFIAIFELIKVGFELNWILN